MAVYHGGQYEKCTGVGPRSESWGLRKKSRRPRTLSGFTVCIVNDKGHFLDDKHKSPVHPNTSYVNTWDLPCKVPANIGTLTGYSCEKANQLIQDRIDWTNDLKRVWLRIDPKYQKLMDHYRAIPGTKTLVPLHEFACTGLESSLQVAGIHDDRCTYPPSTIPEGFLVKAPKKKERKKVVLSNKTHCFHWQGFSHPKELPCSQFKDEWKKIFPACLASVGCERDYQYY